MCQISSSDALRCVPPVVASGPWQLERERMPQVEDGPREHDNIERVQPEGHDGGRVAHALENGTNLPHAQAAHTHRLTDGDLQEEHGYAAEDERERVRHQKCSAAVLVAQIRKAPHVAQADRVAHAREDKVHLGAPLVAVLKRVPFLHGGLPLVGLTLLEHILRALRLVVDRLLRCGRTRNQLIRRL